MNTMEVTNRRIVGMLVLVGKMISMLNFRIRRM